MQSVNWKQQQYPITDAVIGYDQCGTASCEQKDRTVNPQITIMSILDLVLEVRSSELVCFTF